MSNQTRADAPVQSEPRHTFTCGCRYATREQGAKGCPTHGEPPGPPCIPKRQTPTPLPPHPEGRERERVKLNSRDYDRLETIDWGETHFGSLATNRQFPRRAMLRLVRMGLARSVGAVALCDDDGFGVQPERYGEGGVLTEMGREILEAERAEYRRYIDTLVGREASHV